MKPWERKCPRCGTISHMMMIHSCHGEIRYALGEPPEDAVKLGYAVDQDWDDEGEEAIRADEREKVLEEFAEFCHEHYLGCVGDDESKTGYWYGYDNEIVCLIEPFFAKLNQLKEEGK